MRFVNGDAALRVLTSNRFYDGGRWHFSQFVTAYRAFGCVSVYRQSDCSSPF
jgi:hypothetical protein